MIRAKILHEIKSAVISVDENAEVILFGSRARGDHKDDSDWDLLILPEKEISLELEGAFRDLIYDLELVVRQAKIVTSSATFFAPTPRRLLPLVAKATRVRGLLDWKQNPLRLKRHFYVDGPLEYEEVFSFFLFPKTYWTNGASPAPLYDNIREEGMLI